MKNNTIVRDAAILFVITLIAGIALGAVHAITLEPIRQAQIAAANATYAEVFPEAVSFEETDALNAAIETANTEIDGWGLGNKAGKLHIDEAMVAKDASGQDVGYMINATSGEGYGGDIRVSVGITGEGKMTGIGFLKISETPGLGMRAKTPEFRDQFTGKDATGQLAAIKGGTADERGFNTISGASFTSGAVGKAVNAAIKFVNDYAK